MNDLTGEVQPLPRLTQEPSLGFNIPWKNILLFTLGIACLFLLMRGCDVGPNPNPDVDPIPGVEGTYVMIIEDSSEHQTLTAPKQAIFTSQEINEWADDNCTTYGDGYTAFLKIDHQEKLDQIDPISKERMFPEAFEILREKIKEEVDELPAIGVVTPKGYATRGLPEDPDRTLQFLNEAVK